MRSRSYAVVGLTAAVPLILIVSPSPRAQASAEGPWAAPPPGSWTTVPPGPRPPLWLLTVVVVVGLLGLVAVAAGARYSRRLSRELRWAGGDAEVETAETAHFVSDVPDGLVPGFEVDLEIVPDSPPASRRWLSPATELTVPTSVRALVCPDLETDALVETMCARLPERGLAADRMGERFRLARPTWRLIDRRILAAAAGLLDSDVADPLIACLARLEQVRDAGQRTLVDREQPELIETLVPPGPLTVSHGAVVTVDVAGEVVATVRFRLDVMATLGETALVVRRGEILEVACQELYLSAALVLVGRALPLLSTETLDVVDVHLAPRPPVIIPLVSAPASSDAQRPDHAKAG